MTTEARSGEALLRLVEVMNQLRSPGGCPWDAEQTHASLVQYLIEETYETVDAIDREDRVELVEELGDVLLQVVFHARIAEEHPQSPFTIDDVANGIADKLIRRHPHVFQVPGKELTEVTGSASVEAQWQQIKNEEKSRTRVTDGVPVSLPALTQLSKLLTRLANANQSAPVPANSAELVAQLRERGVDLADLVVAAVADMHSNGLDPDGLLRERVRAFRGAVDAVSRPERD